MKCTIYKSTTSRRERNGNKEGGNKTQELLHLGLVNLILLVNKDWKILTITNFYNNEYAPTPKALSLGASQKGVHLRGALFCESCLSSQGGRYQTWPYDILTPTNGSPYPPYSCLSPPTYCLFYNKLQNSFI